MNCSNKLIKSVRSSLHCVNILVVCVFCGIAALAGWCVIKFIKKYFSIVVEFSSIVLFLCIRYYLLWCSNKLLLPELYGQGERQSTCFTWRGICNLEYPLHFSIATFIISKKFKEIKRWMRKRKFVLKSVFMICRKSSTPYLFMLVFFLSPGLLCKIQWHPTTWRAAGCGASRRRAKRHPHHCSFQKKVEDLRRVLWHAPWGEFIPTHFTCHMNIILRKQKNKPI